jgi:predicted  nucleic acid-binding Zn-ribbon protein
VIVAGEAKEAELTLHFKQLGSELLAHMEAENAARAGLLGVLSPELRERYETVRASKHGIAVGVLKDGMCSACRVGLPAGKIDALEHGPDIASCPNCGRILVVRGASGE